MSTFKDFPTAEESRVESACRAEFESIAKTILSKIVAATKEGKYTVSICMNQSLYLMKVDNETDWISMSKSILDFLNSKGYGCEIDTEKEILVVSWEKYVVCW